MEVQQVQLSETTPRSLWRDFVSQRQPVVIHGVADNWSSFSDDALIEKAGDAVVMVERRSGSSDAYGQGRKSPMPLREFLAHMQRGDSDLYLSTQEVGVGHDGHPLPYGPPLVDMDGCFPLQQPLLPNLAPQSINMWMGCAPEGSSSGLHHDFHDNLYVLLRGTKRFRLFPPSSAPGMYVAGSIRHLHANGRFVYEGQGDIRPDGANAHDVKLWEAHNSADTAAAAAAAARSAKEADAAEALLEQQLERMLQEGAAHAAADGDSPMDDYVDSDTAAAALSSESESESAADSDDDDSPGRQASHAHNGSSSSRKAQQQLPRPAVSEPPPPSFSQVDLSLPEPELRRRFPRFPGLEAASVVVLQAGDMLFLPAGWFHEVTSFGGSGLDGGHLAINYWFHPPDNLDPGKAGFSRPYTSPYFPTMWANRRSWVQAETRAWQQQQQQQQQQQRKQLQQEHAQGQPQNGTNHPQQQHQQQPSGPSSSRKRRRIKWAPTVCDPGNVYEAFNTRAGTATGSFAVLPQHSGLRDASGSDTDDSSDSAPDDEQQHHQLGAEVADGIKALEAYFEEDPQALDQLLASFMAERRARLTAAASAAHGQTLPLPRLRGRRHHYTVVSKTVRRQPKPKPPQPQPRKK